MDLSNLSEEQKAELQEKLKNMSPEQIAQLQAQQSIFRQIVAGKVPSKKIYEDENCLGILDINPASKGHILLLSKKHYAILPQMPDDELGHLFLVTKELSLALLKKIRASGTNILIANGLAAGQKVQDFMIHLIPRRDGDEVFDYEKKIIDLESRKKYRALIAAKVSEITGVEDKYSGSSVDEKSAGSEDGTNEENVSGDLDPEENGEELGGEDREDDSSGEGFDSDEDSDGDEDYESDSGEEENSRDKASTNLDDIANLF